VDERAGSSEADRPASASGPAARRRTAYALRELLTQLSEADAAPERFDELSAQIESINEAWRAIPERVEVGSGNANGWRSLLLPDVSFDFSDPARLFMYTRIGVGFEGPPGRIHGGVVAYLFDNMVGHVTMHAGLGITLTAKLAVNYAAATPINTDLKLVAWVERHEGRKFWVEAELLVDGQVTASCEALMISPRPGVFRPT
jgi:Thioesterase superfamily